MLFPININWASLLLTAFLRLLILDFNERKKFALVEGEMEFLVLKKAKFVLQKPREFCAFRQK